MPPLDANAATPVENAGSRALADRSRACRRDSRSFRGINLIVLQFRLERMSARRLVAARIARPAHGHPQ